MPYKNPIDKKRHNHSYYWKNRKRLRAYRKTRQEEDRKVWQKWCQKKKDEERKQKIRLGQIYKPKQIYF